MMLFTQRIANHLKHIYLHYGDFKGRAPRSEFLRFVGVFLLLLIIAAVLDNNIFPYEHGSTNSAPFFSAVLLLSIIPYIALVVRRFHDLGLSAWFLLLKLIPGIGTIIVLILCLIRGVEKSNKYGPDPRQVHDESDNKQDRE